MNNNPLLLQTTLPLFQHIKPEHALPAIEMQLSENRHVLKTLLEQQLFTWENLILPLQSMSVKLAHLWSPISHLNNVINTHQWREAYNQCIPLLTQYHTEMGQNKALYDAIESIPIAHLDQVQQKIIRDHLRDFRLSGVALQGDEKKRFSAIQLRLSQLTTKFEENILDATQAWVFKVDHPSQLKGLPADMQSKTELTLDAPCYLSVMKYAEDRALRRLFYSAYNTRASDQGPNAGQFDNSSLMVDILQLRYEKAQLLGFKNYADYSLATKMAESTQEVFDFLQNLASKSKSFAEQEIKTLKHYAKESLGIEDFSAWDVAYASEKLQQKQYAVSDEMLRPYFPEDAVFLGMFSIIQKIYGMSVQEIKEVEVWHPDVRFFEIRDESGALRGQFYTDLYARAQKRGGAWMDDCRQRFVEHGKTYIPVAYLTCNFNPPSEGNPALLTHDEVITLFHEFGHGLHHLLTLVDYADVSGIAGVEWDAVELPSQFMENFCWHHASLPSSHYETQQPFPKELFEALLAAKNFQSAMMMLRQLEFALFDFTLHAQSAPTQPAEIQACLDKIRADISIMHPPSFNRFQHSFSHIFAGGYAAGYYSYKWAEVLSSDAFAAFEENGVLDRTTGDKFLHAILERGGSKSAMELFIDFRGRKPMIEPLLKQSGLISFDD